MSAVVDSRRGLLECVRAAQLDAVRQQALVPTGIRRMANWIRRISSWLAQPKLLWIAAGVLALALCPVLLFDLEELEIRFVGLALQLFGLLTVVHGISQTRKLFNLPPVTSSALRWLKAFPRLRQNRGISREIGIAAELDSAGRVKPVLSAPPGAPLEDRVRALEGNFRLLDRRLDDLDGRMEESDRQASGALTTEREERQRDVQNLNEKLALLETGGLSVSLTGLLWLMAGLVITTASQEIARWR